MNFVAYYCLWPLSLMDRMTDSGSVGMGSIPVEVTKC